MPVVLVVDDDESIRRIATAALDAEGYETVAASGGMEAFELLASSAPDLVLLDIVMPGVSGLEVLDVIHRSRNPPPVILLSTLRAEENVVRGLRLGASDYISKPFSIRELTARVQAQLRRGGNGAGSDVTEHGDLRIDGTSRQVTVAGVVVETTAKEFDLLHFLASRPGRVFTRRQLLVEVWKSSADFQQASTVTEHVRRLRAKVERDASRPTRIVTVRGVGYRYERRAGPAPERTKARREEDVALESPLEDVVLEELRASHTRWSR